MLDAVVLDPAATPAQASHATVLAGSGDGTFTAIDAPAVGAGARGLALAGLRPLAGVLDLVVATGAGGLVILPNAGSGTFPTADALALPGGATAVAAAPLHQQDAPPLDVVVGTAASGVGAVGALSNCTEEGCPDRLTPPVAEPLGQGTTSPAALVVARLEGTDPIDAALVDAGTDSVRVLGFDPELFRYQGPPTVVATGDRPVAIAAGDVDGDGLVDLVTADAGAGALSVLVQSAGGGFDRSVTGRGCTDAADVALADLDGDGALDIVAACPGAGVARVLLGTGSGTFVAGPVLEAASGAIEHVAVADLDGDAAPDVLATSSARTLHVFRAGAAPTVAQSRLDFAETDVASRSTIADAVVGNRGPGSAAIQDVRVVGDGAASFAIAANGCAGQDGGWLRIAPSATCEIGVRFAPKVAGALAATLEIVPVRGPVLSVDLAGVAVPAGRPRISRLAVRRLNARRLRVGLVVSRSATVAVRLERRVGRRYRLVTTVRRASGPGAVTLAIARRLLAGRHRVVVSATDVRGRRTSVVRALPLVR